MIVLDTIYLDFSMSVHRLLDSQTEPAIIFVMVIEKRCWNKTKTQPNREWKLIDIFIDLRKQSCKSLSLFWLKTLAVSNTCQWIKRFHFTVQNVIEQGFWPQFWGERFNESSDYHPKILEPVKQLAMLLNSCWAEIHAQQCCWAWIQFYQIHNL